MAVAVEGLKELEQAFRKADKQTTRELRVALRAAAEPVKTMAEGLAVGNIRHIHTKGTRLDWSRMRIGEAKAVVYMVPKQRGRNTRSNYRRYHRDNLKELLLARAMEPALNANAGRVEANVERVLGSVARQWEVTA